MKNQNRAGRPNQKVLSIVVLFIFASMITLAGASFIVFSVLNGVTLKVLNSQIPGAVFGAIIAFLGARYLISVKTLKDEVLGSDSRFSLSNFKKDGAKKRRSKANER